MNTFSSWDEVPIFDSEEAEALFWSENRPDLRLMESAVSGSSESQESVAISLRIDPRMLARIKRLARARFLNYQSMMKQWLSERMEEELAQDNQTTPMKNQNRNRSSAFTLVELLVVIAIIGIIAGLVTSLAFIANKKKKIVRTQTSLAQLKLAIETYKEKKGFYPPDNPNNDQTNGLYYELAGLTRAGGLYTTLDGADSITDVAATLSNPNAIGVAGFANSTTATKGSDDYNVESFIQVKSVELETVTTISGLNVKLLDVPVPGGNNSDINPWHYNSHNPVNNPGSYDLWAEIMIGSQTNIIGNWSDHPIVK
jgi:prepilin-type N-terminal cleavage/methylation domain-containing protein